eukprot:2125769-Rhodomonas_salina.4
MSNDERAVGSFEPQPCLSARHVAELWKPRLATAAVLEAIEVSANTTDTTRGLKQLVVNKEKCFKSMRRRVLYSPSSNALYCPACLVQTSVHMFVTRRHHQGAKIELHSSSTNPNKQTSQLYSVKQHHAQDRPRKYLLM